MPDLQDLINAIPVAQDGHIISRDYHNTLRDALVAMAGKFGSTPAIGTQSIYLAPALFPAEPRPNGNTRPNWNISLALASSSGPAHGWLPLVLPQGAELQCLAVDGFADQGNPAAFTVSLGCQPITQRNATVTILSVPITSLGGPFHFEGTTLQFPQLSIVDNTKYKYFVEAQLTTDAFQVEIASFRVDYLIPSVI